jgi:ribosomal protein S30
MNRLSDLLRSLLNDKDRTRQSKPKSRSRSEKDNGMKTKRRRSRRHQSHFYNPDMPNKADSSSDGPEISELVRRQTETLTRIEDAEAALAKERKRVEQLEHRRREVEVNEEQHRIQRDEHASLSPREKNRRAYEKAVARVDRSALRKIEELERRFAYIDKVLEMRAARQEREADKWRERETGDKETEHEHQNETRYPEHVEGEQSAEGERDEWTE